MSDPRPEFRGELTVEELIELLGLEEHPEGGYFAESYRSPRSLPDHCLPEHRGARAYGTAIYYLLPQGSRSRLHRLASDEIWHLYRGGPLSIWELAADGTVTEMVLGGDLRRGQVVQHVVRAGVWFAAVPHVTAPYALVGCTVAPGFDFADFELAERERLLARYPEHRELIERLI